MTRLPSGPSHEIDRDGRMDDPVQPLPQEAVAENLRGDRPPVQDCRPGKRRCRANARIFPIEQAGSVFISRLASVSESYTGTPSNEKRRQTVLFPAFPIPPVIPTLIIASFWKFDFDRSGHRFDFQVGDLGRNGVLQPERRDIVQARGRRRRRYRDVVRRDEHSVFTRSDLVQQRSGCPDPST